jgi:nucleoside-diphosphate-sugar epimerase
MYSFATYFVRMKTKMVVVAGATGKLGQLVVDNLLAKGASVRALVRDKTKPEALALVNRGVEVHEAGLNAPKALHAALEGAYALVSTLQGGPDVIVQGQLQLLEAAKAHSVRRMIPSDYSFNFFTLPEGVNINSDWRRAFALRAREVRGSVEVVHIMQGMFADATVLGFLGLFERDSHTVRYWGDGATTLDWTTWEDTAKYIAAAALDDALVPEQLCVAGDQISLLEFAELLEKHSGTPTVRKNLGTLEALKHGILARRGREPENVYAWLPLMYAEGMFGGKASLGPLANGRYPEIKPESVRDTIARGAWS